MVENSGTPNSHTLSLPLVSLSLRLTTKTKPIEVSPRTIGLDLFSEGCTREAWFPKFRLTTVSSLCDLYNN